MIQIQQRPLGALEQDAPAARERFMKLGRDVAHHGPQPPGDPVQLVEERAAAHGGQGRDFRVLLAKPGQVPVRALDERPAVEEIGDPQAGARGLVAVGEADAAAGGAERPRAAFGGGFHRAVIGQDEVCRGTHAEARSHFDPPRLEACDLLLEPRHVHDHAVADQAARARMHHARGNEVEDDRLAVAKDAMPGVGPALVTGDHVGLGAQGVDHLALALVAPLRAHDHRARHAPLRLENRAAS